MKLTPKQLEQMWDNELRISHIFHIQGALTGGEQLPDEFQGFLEDFDWGPKFEEWMPGKGATMFENMKVEWQRERKHDRRGANEMFREAICDVLMHRCPATFVVVIDRALPKCVRANPARPGLGTFHAGFGCYRPDEWFTDSISEAVEKSLALAIEHRRATWQEAIDEGRVQKPIVHSEEEE
jgi:hypothetical protein